MALRKIVMEGDEVLTKKCRPVEKFDKKLHDLLDDMYDTMRVADGCGLAAPQVGILRCAVVICTDPEGNDKIELINPEIISQSGEQNECEGCLSAPGIYGITKRPMNVKVKAFDRNGEGFVVEGEDLLARALCHEIDHLNGIMFRSHVTEYIDEEQDK